MNRRGFLRFVAAGTATGVLMPAHADRLLHMVRNPASVIIEHNPNFGVYDAAGRLLAELTFTDPDFGSATGQGSVLRTGVACDVRKGGFRVCKPKWLQHRADVAIGDAVEVTLTSVDDFVPIGARLGIDT